MIYSFQGCQQQHYGTSYHGLCVQDFFGTLHCWRHSLLTVLETVQDAQAWLHCLQAVGQDDVHVGPYAYYHNGLASEGDPRLFRHTRRQFARLAILTTIHSGERKH